MADKVYQCETRPGDDLAEIARRVSAVGGEMVSDGVVIVVFHALPEAAASLIARVRAGDPEPPVVPRSVTPLQARRALRAAGLLPLVKAALDEAPEEIQEAWEYGLEVRRDSPLIAAMASALELTDEQLDNLFIAAGAADEVPAVPPASGAAEITPGQLFKGLALHGLIPTAEALAAAAGGPLPAAIEAFVAALPDGVQQDLRSLLAPGGAVVRSGSLFRECCGVLGLGDADLETVWAVCAGVEEGGQT